MRKVELMAAFWTLAGDVYAMGPSEVATFPLRDRVEAAAWAGYTGFAIAYQDIMHNAATMGFKGMKRLFDDNGMKHIEIEFLGDWFTTGEAKKASDKVRGDLMEAAVALGARDMKIAPEMWTEACDIPKMTAAFVEVCEHAKKAGTNVAMEIMPFCNVNTLKKGRAIVEGADQQNGGLCIDIWHVIRGGISFDELRSLPARYFKSVEVDDAAAEIRGATLWNDTLFERLYCGEGSFDIPGFIAAVESTGYNGCYAVEIINERYRKLPLREQARRSFDGAMAQFAKVK